MRRRGARQSGTYDGLPASVLASLHDPASELHAACDDVREAAARLVDRAQREAALRTDIDVDDLLALAAAVGWLSGQTGTERASRVAAIIHASLGRGSP